MIVVGVSEDRPRGKILARGTQGNLVHLHAFHRLCRKYGLCPTYFVSYPALRSPHLDWLTRAKALGECELGTLSQSWTTPPFDANENRLTGTPSEQQSRSIVLSKLETLSRAFRQRFGIAPLSHMSDGWDFSSNLINALVANCYAFDCSFAPGVSSLGFPLDNPANGPYFPSLQDPLARGGSPILEIPIATTSWMEGVMSKADVLPPGLGALLSPLFAGKFGESAVLDPLRMDLRHVRFLLEVARSKGASTIVLPVNSFDLGVGTSDLASTEEELSDLLQRLDYLFRTIVDTLQLSSLGVETYGAAHLNGINA